MTRLVRKRRSGIGGVGFVLRTAVLLVVLYGLGFVAFLITLPEPHETAAGALSADGIVALTGAQRRLAAALDLLERGAGKRLLISGVNPNIGKSELRGLLEGGPAFDCCTDLGFEASDTRGNAVETAKWVRAHGYHSLIVVTGYEHMPRSLLELSSELPDIEIIPFPVARPDRTGLIDGRLSQLNGEYAKYLASWVRLSLMPRDTAAHT